MVHKDYEYLPFLEKRRMKNGKLQIPVWMHILHNFVIEQNGRVENMSRIAKKLDVTHSHIIKMIKVLEDYNFIVPLEKKGRTSSYELTKIGKEVGLSIERIINYRNLLVIKHEQ